MDTKRGLIERVHAQEGIIAGDLSTHGAAEQQQQRKLRHGLARGHAAEGKYCSCFAFFLPLTIEYNKVNLLRWLVYRYYIFQRAGFDY